MQSLPRNEASPYTTTSESLVFLHDPLLDYRLATTKKDQLAGDSRVRVGRFGKFVTRLVGK